MIINFDQIYQKGFLGLLLRIIRIIINFIETTAVII